MLFSFPPCGATTQSTPGEQFINNQTQPIADTIAAKFKIFPINRAPQIFDSGGDVLLC
jgi:hypothetical protein